MIFAIMDRTDRSLQYLRGLAVVLHSPEMEEVADWLEYLAAQLFLADEKIAAYEAEPSAADQTVTEFRGGRRVTFKKTDGHRSNVISAPPKPSS